jgi:opacity protein-like surface antigen
MPSQRRCLVPLALLALLAAVPARADGPRFELTPFGGYRMGGSFDVEDEDGDDRGVDLDDGSSWGVDLGVYRDQASFYELLYSTQDTSFDSNDPALDDVDVTTQYYHVGGTVLFANEQWAVPWLSLTVGATEFSADGFDSETKFSLSLGGGLRLPFSDNFAATLGLRGYLTFIDSDTDLFCYSGPTTGGCLVKSAGSSYIQGEATVGLTLRF